MTAGEVIDVCVCTFRRPALAETLASLAAQVLPQGTSLRVIVADNDSTDTRRCEIEGIGQTLGLPLTYVHAPERNISIARNACLAAASGDWLAFIDDDEVARPDWLARLLAARAGRQVVFGQVLAIYPETAPAWIKRSDFHSTRIAGRDAEWNGYTGNVLIDRQFISAHGLHFDVALGQIGGEDTMFFLGAHLAGACFAYVADAIASEPVPLDRMTMHWLVRRRFRSGQIHFMVLQNKGKVLAGVIGSAAKVVFCAGLALAHALSPARRTNYVLRAALHLGVFASGLGFSPYREYAASDEQR
ncbi:MAG: glycosyltransferase family 2 protein [Novosphingobium sp.]